MAGAGAGSAAALLRRARPVWAVSSGSGTLVRRDRVETPDGSETSLPRDFFARGLCGQEDVGRAW